MRKNTKNKVAKKSAKRSPKVKKSAKTQKKTSVPKGVSRKNITKKKKTALSKNLGEKKMLVVAVGDQCFWIKDGPILKDLVDLKNVLYDITQEQFKYHVDAIKNDFASWVKYVLRDDYASEVVRKAKTAKSMLKSVEKALQKYNH